MKTLLAALTFLFHTQGPFDSPESAVYDPSTEAIYVSNQVGGPMDLTPDGKGYITKLAADGSVVAPAFVTGLDMPHGLAVQDGTLWAADLGELVEIDLATATIVAHHALPGSILPNDVAADATAVYVSDSIANIIYRLDLTTRQVGILAQGPALDSPNGITFHAGELYVATMGDMRNFPQGTPGRILAVDLATAAIRPVTETLGRLDGIAVEADGRIVVSDFAAGTISRVDPATQEITPLRSNLAGVADIGLGEGGEILVPETFGQTVSAIAP